MRICFVSHGSGRGGAEEVLLETLECLKEQGVECLVLMPGDMGLGADLRKMGIPFWRVPFWPWMGHKGAWGRTQSAARNLLLSVPVALRLKAWKPDIIYSNTMVIGFGALLAKLLGKPHVWHLHEIGYEDHGLRFDFGDKFSYGLIGSAAACIAVSKITADKFAEHIDRSKITVMFQSVHRRPQWQEKATGAEAVPPRKHALRCVIVGRISEGKRQEDAVVAMDELRTMGVDAELLVIGRSNPGYRERLDEIIRDRDLGDRVNILGSVNDRLPYVQSSDVVLMCSRFEAFGRVTVEGMLSGKPVVAANTGANPELIRDGENGLLYTVRDTRELASKIKYLSENPAIASAIGRNAQTWSAAMFSKERFSDEIIPFLRGIAMSGGSGAAREEHSVAS